jgi:hypothetical protein
MSARGYRPDLLDEQSDALSVEYPQVMDSYRTAHEIAARSEQGNASTEDLRKAMLEYRSIFSQLVETPEEARS